MVNRARDSKTKNTLGSKPSDTVIWNTAISCLLFYKARCNQYILWYCVKFKSFQSKHKNITFNIMSSPRHESNLETFEHPETD